MEAILIPEFRQSILETENWNARLVCSQWAKALPRLPLEPIKQLWNGPNSDLLALLSNQSFQSSQRYLIMPQQRAELRIYTHGLQKLKEISITTAKPFSTDQVFDTLQISDPHGSLSWDCECSSSLIWTLALSRRWVKGPTCFQQLDVPELIVDNMFFVRLLKLKEPVEMRITLENVKRPKSTQCLVFYQELTTDSETTELRLSDIVSGFVIRGQFDRVLLYYSCSDYPFADWSAAEGAASWRLNRLKPVKDAYFFRFPNNAYVNFSKIPTARIILKNLVGVAHVAAKTVTVI